MSSTTLPSSHNCLEGMAGLVCLVLCPSHRRLRWKHMLSTTLCGEQRGDLVPYVSVQVLGDVHQK